MKDQLLNSIQVSPHTQFAVLGLGKFGRSITKTLYENGLNVLCCDLDEHKVQDAAGYSTHAFQADVSEKAALEKIGIGNFDVVIIAFSSDFEAAAITATIVKEMGVGFILAKANGLRQKQILESIGVDRVVLPEKEMGERIAYGFITNDLLDYIHRSDKYDIIEMKPLPKWIGISLQKLRLRQTEGINIIAIIRDNDVMAVLDAQTELFTTDNLIVLKSRQ
ncbi:TrkA family potassium uptake protein [Oscillospiraceae bacterium MB08-C2-2]|nr:TrkA family potassium uptake protein [Oscillospiraceae bacterium MB08-C2-2]